MKKAVLILLAVIVSFVLGMLVESKVHKCDVGDVHTSVEYVSESHHAPVPSDSNVVRYDTIWPDNKEVKNIPKSGNKSAENIPQKAEKIWEDTLKSAENIPQSVVIPITQKVYKDSDYTAYVSGYHSSLDSISVRHKVTTITIKQKARRWNVGVSAGYGMTPKGFQPYVGIGVTFNLLK
jgi:opacity protein-like surface antigen